MDKIFHTNRLAAHLPVFLLLFSIFAQPASASLVYLNAEWTIQASAAATVDTTNEFDTPPEVSVITNSPTSVDEMLDASASLQGASATASSSQLITLSADGIDAGAMIAMTAFADDFNTAGSEAFNRFSVTFRSDSATPYRLSGTIENFDAAGQSGNLRWAGSGVPGIAGFSESIFVTEESRDFVFEGVFREGQLLELSFLLQGGAEAGPPLPFGVPSQSSSGSFTASLQLAPVPLPAAVWLFGSALIGLVGISRKKLQACS
jgi:hypothetical protein